MKKFFLRIAILLLALFCAPHVHAEHLEFHHVPIRGTVDDFISQLTEKGYVFDEYVKGTAKMTGRFSGQDVTLYIHSTNATHTAWKVDVYLPVKHGWPDLKKYYTGYKQMYTEKYGKPALHVEFLPKGYEEGTGYEVFVLKADRAKFRSVFKLPDGTITVRLDPSERLVITYEDREGTALAPIELMDDL